MNMMTARRGLAICVAACVAVVCSFQSVGADRFVGTSYIIDASVANTTSGANQTSTTYKLTSTSGETAIGSGSAGSYKMGMGFVSQLEKNFSLTVQPSGLVASYHLDEPSGTSLTDQSIYNAFGTMQGTLTSVAGKIDTALSFNGSSQAISIASNSQTQLSSTGTLEAWVKSSTTTGSMAVVSKNNNFWLGLSTGKAALYDWTSATMCADTVTIADGTWHHIAATLNSGATNGSTVYVDGVAKKTCTWTPASQTGYVALGSVQTGVSTYTQYFTGSADHVKVFNRLLSTDEVLREYSAQNSAKVSGLSLGSLTPGISNMVLSDIIVRTDAGGYTLAINQDHDLTSGSYTIPSISGSIGTPAAWTEGTTKGLGFTLTGTNATALPGAWNSGNSYASFPGTATTFYTRTGLQGGTDYVTMRVRADVAWTQTPSGTPYSNLITVTGTITP